MPWLIDGYNLMHAMGVLHGRRGPEGMEHARRRFLDLLRAGHGDAAGEVTVVFDAAGAPATVAAEQVYQGIQVRFAVRQPEADDLIEELIRAAPTPGRLTVVSDDRRVREAARRRRCPTLGCGEYLDWLTARRGPGRPSVDEETAKPQAGAGAEAERWIKEFADLDDELNELSGGFPPDPDDAK